MLESSNKKKRYVRPKPTKANKAKANLHGKQGANEPIGLQTRKGTKASARDAEQNTRKIALRDRTTGWVVTNAGVGFIMIAPDFPRSQKRRIRGHVISAARSQNR